MKPYLLIRNEDFYPSGGTGDWIQTFSTREEAEQYIKDKKFNEEDCVVVDLRTWMEMDIGQEEEWY